MPLFQFFSFAGAALLALLFVSDSYLPKPVERQDTERSYKIRVASEVIGQEAITFSGHPVQFAVAETGTTVSTPAEAATPSVANSPRDSLAQMTPAATTARVEDARPARRVAKAVKPRPKPQEPPPAVFGWTNQSAGFSPFGFARFN